MNRPDFESFTDLSDTVKTSHNHDNICQRVSSDTLVKFIFVTNKVFIVLGKFDMVNIVHAFCCYYVG